MASFKSVVLALILLQLSIGIVNMTNIFPVEETVNVVPENKINELRDDLNKNIPSKEDEQNKNVLDYFNMLGTVVYIGISMTISFIGLIFTGVPEILKMFYVPDALAYTIGYAVDAIVILGIGYKLFSRGG